LEILGAPVSGFPKKMLTGGTEIGCSDWVAIGPDMNQSFANATRDPEPLQIDGQAFAHGFMTISLLSDMAGNAIRGSGRDEEMLDSYLLNYGFNRMRLIESVPLGARVRGHFKTADSGPTTRGDVTIIPLEVTVEIEGADRPALVGEWLVAFTA
jgi:acyl dehydratase